MLANIAMSISCALGVGLLSSAAGAAFAADNPPSVLPSWLKLPALPGRTPPVPAAPAKSAPGSSGAADRTGGSAPAAGLMAPNLATQEQARRLFVKGTVTGEDLKQELEAVKAAAADARSQTALASVLGQASAQLAGEKTHNFLTDLGGKLKELAGDLLRRKAVSYSDKALGDFLGTLTGDDQALRKETITLPSASNLTLRQQQSVLVMAALVVGSRIAHRILDAAHKDFAGLEGEYTALLNKRQEQASLMADVLDKRRQAMAARDELAVRHMDADLARWLSPEDLKFIDSFGPDTSLRQFANDLGMQNLAIKFLQHRDPTAYAQYRAIKRGWWGARAPTSGPRRGSRHSARFPLVFMQEIVKTAQGRNMYQIFAALPFAGDYIKEAVPLIKLSSDALFMGLVAEPGSLKRHYRLVRSGTSVDVNNADAVFSALERSKDAIHFSDALFRNETPGFIYHVYLCDHGAAGALIDEAVKPDNRRTFAEQYLQLPDGAGFTFANALNDGMKTPGAQMLAETLLARDRRISAATPAIGEVQRLTASSYARWKTTELTRLILANSQGVYAQMQLGDTVIRLIPSMATIYAYESYADSCGQEAKHEAGGRPAKEPQSKPKSKPKTGTQT